MNKKSPNEKQKINVEQRNLRRNQVIFALLSLLIILSMVISLVRF